MEQARIVGRKGRYFSEPGCSIAAESCYLSML